MKTTGKAFSCVRHLLLLFTILPQIPLNAQEEGRSDHNPVGREAFKLIVESYEYDRDIPLEARIVEKEDFPTHSREKIVIHGGRDEYVPGYLAIPKSGSHPYPCVLLMHAGGDRKPSLEYDTESQRPDRLLEAGFAVLALDAQYHGERMINNNYEPPLKMVFEHKWFYRIRDLLIETVVNYRRAIDYVATRSEIDPSRIGAHGVSMGGHMTLLLTGIDSRVKVAVMSVSPLGYSGHFSALPKAVKPYNFAAAIGPRPFLMQMGRQDKFSYTVEEVENMFSLIESPIKKLTWYDSGHFLPLDKAKPEMVKWFDEHLK